MTTQAQLKIEQSNYIKSLVEWLASFGGDHNGGVTRLLYTPEWSRAQQALQEKMTTLGLDVYYDDVGNLFGRLIGEDGGSSVILTGSHIDTVVSGGKYDGAYGVLASLVAVERLQQLYGPPKKTIEVVSLCEEEGSRFPLTFWGSGNITGKYDMKDVANICDSDGIPFMQAMNDAGFGLGKYQAPSRKDVASFIELHVEQGAVLEREGHTIGIVTHIVGQRRFNVEVVGESNHAGTTPMSYRHDALSTASELIAYISKKAREMDPYLVATVGKINAHPNMPNVVAGKVTFSIDIRHHEEELLDNFCAIIFPFFQSIASGNGVNINTKQWMDIAPVAMDAELTGQLQSVTFSNKVPSMKLVSGAGHDAQIFGTYCPTSLLFVPSQNGISHSPKEFTEIADLEKGIDILTEFLYRLAYEEGRNENVG